MGSIAQVMKKRNTALTRRISMRMWMRDCQCGGEPKITVKKDGVCVVCDNCHAHTKPYMDSDVELYRDDRDYAINKAIADWNEVRE